MRLAFAGLSTDSRVITMSGTTDDPENRTGDPVEPVDEPVDEAKAPVPDQPAEQTDQVDLSDQGQTDTAWQQIVAELSDLSTDPDPELTASTPVTSPTFDFPVAPWVPEPAHETSDPRAWRRSPEAEALEDSEGEFVPPDPGFSLSTDRMRNLGWFAVVAAPVAAVLVSIFWTLAPSEVYLALSAAFLAGVGALVWRLPSTRDDDPGSGGAVV